MRDKILNILKYLLGWPFSILAFVFIIRVITPQASQILTRLTNPNFTLLGISTICFLLFYFMRSVVWHLLLKVYKGNIRYKASAYYWSASELKRYIPGNIWGFLARTFSFSEIGIEKKDIARLILIEAGVFVMGTSIISLLAVPFLRTTVFPEIPVYYGQIAWSVMLFGSVIYLYNFKIHKLWKKFSPIDNLLILLSASLAVLFFGFGYYFAISAIAYLPIELFFTLSGFFALSFLIGALSLITPAGFGVREGLIIIGLQKIISTAEASFTALFARFMLVLSELLFVLFAFIIHNAKNKLFLRIETWIGRHKHEAILASITLIYILYFSVVSFLRYENFYTGRFDLGNMVQTVWNTTQGRIFQFTDPAGVENLSRLSYHADFILIVLAPFYALWEDPRMLLLIQVLIVGLGSFFIFAIAKTVLKNKNISLMLSFAYLINPAVQRANIYDFHAVVLSTTLLLGTYYFYLQKKWIGFTVFAILAAITKEQIWLIISIFGLFIFYNDKKRVVGGSVFLLSIAIFYYLISVAIPGARGGDHFALSYFSEFGSNPQEIIGTIFSSPDKLVAIAFEKDHLKYLTQIFSSLGYLSYMSPMMLLFALPDLGINLLSSNPKLHQIYYQYTAAITPFVFISAIYGIKNLRRLLPKIPMVLITSFIATTSISAAYMFGPLPGSKSANLDMFTHQVENKDFINEYIRNVPTEKSISTSNNIGSHMAERETIYMLPHGIGDASYIILLMNHTEPSDSLSAEMEIVKNLRKDNRYILEIEKDEFVVFKKK